MNAPLQERTIVLNLDQSRANDFPIDYDTDLELDWSNLSKIFFIIHESYSYFYIKIDLFADGSDFSWETIEKGRNKYYQQQLANQIHTQMTKTTSLISSALNIHLNSGQNFITNTLSVFMSLETTSIQSLANKVVEQVGNAQFRIPSNFTLSSTNETSILLRVCLIIFLISGIFSPFSSQ